MFERERTVIVSSQLSVISGRPSARCNWLRTTDNRRSLFPGLPTWKLIVIKRLSLHFNAVARVHWRHVSAILDSHGIDKVFMQVIDIFRDAVLERCAHRDVIKEREMLNVLTQTDTSGVWTHGHAKFRSHQDHGQH